MSGERQARGLGMGLSALLGEAARPPASPQPEGSGVREVDVARIRPNPNQPRSHFDEAAIEELARSISAHGVLQPILLRPSEDGFEIVAGERRWRAAQRAQLHSVPAIVREIDDTSTAEIALIENVQREDLNAVEEAEGYRQLIDRYGHTQDDVGRIVHKSRSHVANLLRLLQLPEFVRDSLTRGDISMGHARAVAAADDPVELTRQIIAKGLSVREAERLGQKVAPVANPVSTRPSESKPAQASSADLQALERQLGDLLGLRVKVQNKGDGGSVVLHYSSLDQLDMICQRLSGEPI